MTRRARNADGSLSEHAFQTQILNLASFYGWQTYHTHDSRGSQRGFLDLTIVRAPELIFAELKTEKGRVRPEQHIWVDQLTRVADALAAAAGLPRDQRLVDVYVWRPSDFDEINARLSRGRALIRPLYRDAV